jgi:hypothetical protein
MASATFWFNGGSAGALWNTPQYAYDINLGTFAYLSPIHVALPYSENLWLQSNNCNGVSLGLITKVEYSLYLYGSVNAGSPGARAAIYSQPYFGGVSAGTYRGEFDSGTVTTGFTFGPGWNSAIDITNDPNHPTWGLDFSNIVGLDVLVVGILSGSSFRNPLDRVYDGVIYVTYTPHVASTLSWSTPASGGYSYRNQSLALSGTAVNSVAGVSAVQYNIDGAAWVTCTGTISWSATVSAATLNALSHGSHTLNTRVQRNGDSAWTTTTTRTFVISPLPAQTI